MNTIARFTARITDNLPLLVLYLVLLSAPCCFKIVADSFHFAKVHFTTGFISSICFAMALCWMASYGKSIKYAVSTILWVLFFTEFFIFAHFQRRLIDRTIYLMLQTDTQECTEFLSTYIFRLPTLFPILASAIVAGAYYGLRWYWNRWRPLNLLKPIWLILFFFSAAFMVASIIWCGYMIDYVSFPTVVQVCVSTSRMNEYLVDNRELEKAVLASDGCIITRTEGHPHIVFVIGESFNPNHSPLYGYSINTTPHLLNEFERGNLVAFTDAVAPSQSTGIMMDIIYSAAPPDAGAERWQYPLVPSIFKHAGYYVSLHDNQCTKSVGDSYFDVRNCQFFNSYIVATHSLDYRNDAIMSFDRDFVIRESNGKSALAFDIYHLMGQHIPANKRYPIGLSVPDFDYSCRPELDEKQKADVAHYDAATYYNDLTIAEIIKKLQGEDAVMVYVSDHGEEIHDFRNQYGRTHGTITADFAHNIFRVPLLVYTTPEFRRLHPDLYADIVNAANKPVYTGDINQLLLHLGSIQSRYYNSALDPLSEDYDCKGRRILNNETDYDRLAALTQ